jgi:hypothetical protein
MQTTDLIEQLAGNLQPTARRDALRRLTLGLVAGGPIAAAIVLTYFGIRADLGVALLTPSFWMKWAFALGITAAAIGLCVRLARPEGHPGRLPVVLAVPFLFVAVIGVIQLSAVPAEQRLAFWLGSSALQCPWNIAGLAVPLFFGAFWAMRGLAPTRHRWAGFSAGCLAGAVAAVVYAIHCPETAAPFVATWYSAGILLPALLGLLIGPRALRW